MEKSIEKQLIELYVANVEMLEDGLPPFVNRCRSEAIEAFNFMGLPDKKDEKYKYCDIKSRYNHALEKYFTPLESTCDRCDKLPVDSHEIIITNGYSNDIYENESGVIYGSLKCAANQYPELIEKYYNKQANNLLDSATALNTAMMQDGAFIYIPRNVVVTKPFTVINCLNSEEDIYVYLRNVMIFEENSSAKVIIDSHSSDDITYLVNNVSEIYLHDNVNVEIVELQRENNQTTHISNIYTTQTRSSNFQATMLTISGGFVRNNINTILAGCGAESHNYGLYLPNTGELVDNYTNTEHRVGECMSFEHYKGVASGSGTAVFEGRILVEKDAQKTQAFLENHNILLSDDANVYTKPQLEIYADDVKCSHGATIGQLDSAAIFYMRQRGINEVDAKKLQMYGFVNDIIGKVRIEGLAEFLNHVATQKIESI